MDSAEHFRTKWWALLGISLLAFTAYLDFTIVNTALPFIQKDLNASLLELQWVANIFAVIISMFLIVFGKFGDRWGRKKNFYLGVVFFGVAAIGAGCSPTIEYLIFFRALQALGATMIFVCSAALLADAFPQNEQGKAVSIYGGITGMGLVAGPFLGGILIAAFNWRWVFWINIPLIALGLICCAYSLRHVRPTTHPEKIDWKGLFLLILGLGTLVYGIVAGGQKGWGARSSWLPLTIGLFALFFLFFLDVKAKKPLLNFSIFKNKLICLAAASCFLAGIICNVFLFFDSLYLETVHGFSPMRMGLLLAIMPAGQVVVSFCFNSLLKWFGIAHLFLLSVLAGTVAVFLHWFIGAHSTLLSLFLPFSILGINWGLSNMATITAVNQTVPQTKIGEAIGTLYTGWNMVGAIFLSLSSVLFHTAGTSFIPAFHRVISLNFTFFLLVTLAVTALRFKIKERS